VRFKNKIILFGFFLGLWLGWVIFCHVFAELGLHVGHSGFFANACTGIERL
jgi:hypothetical protein